MNKKMSKRQRDIKTKLMAAICMLLVSSIMMVSTTYAWFTLSTAPEVTGINTAVGANGNLEMALLPVNGNVKTQSEDYGITTGTADSMANGNLVASNVTWGNLVDLTASYGLELVTLYPSALNLDQTGTTILDGAFLKTPVYGADGRVASLATNTYAGVYSTATGKTEASAMVGETEIDNPAGVRLIGTVSGMSDRQNDFRNAISLASAASTNARNAAIAALEDNGNALAQIAVKYATNNNNYTAQDVQALLKMVTDLQTALNQVESGLRQYIYAYQMSISADETAYRTYRDAILGSADVTASTLEQLLTAGTAPATMEDMIDKLAASRAALGTASTNLGSDDVLTGTNIITAMTPLVSIDGMTLNGLPVGTTEKDDLKAKIGSDFIAGRGITLTVPTGSGVFADVADFVGNYGATLYVPASVVISNVEESIPVQMVTATTVTPTYFNQAKAIAAETPIGSDASAAETISNFYGYVIDLAFKTNAADSELRLQTEAIDRIYNNEGDTATEETMGGGATMVFTSSDATNGFQETEMQNLIKHIRIVFFNPTDNTILGYGVMDSSAIELLGGNKMSVGLKMAYKPDPKTETDYIANNKIMDLTQNTAHRLSVLVYLDGTTIKNADVAIGADTSMRGSLNLQFSSSATLKPMVYSDFAEQAGNTPGTPEAITLNNVEVTGATIGAAKYADGKIAIQLTGVAEGSTVTIKVGDADAVEVNITTVEALGQSVTGISHTASGVTADTAIVVTVTAPATGS